MKRDAHLPRGWKAGWLAFLLSAVLLPPPARPASLSRTFENAFIRVSLKDGLSQGSGLSIVQDGQGFLWIGTEDGINRYDGYNFRVYRPGADPDSISEGTGRVLFVDSRGELWVGTSNGLNRYDRDQDRFLHFFHDPNDPQSLTDNYITSLGEGRSGTIWVGTGNGLNAVDPRTSKITRAPIDSRAIAGIVEDADGILWLATSEGLHAFNPASQEVKRYRHDPRDSRSLGGDRLISLFLDRDGTLWAGSEGGGLNVFDRATGTCTRYVHDYRNPRSLSNDTVYAIFRNKAGLMMVGTNDGFNLFDDQTRDFTVLRNNPADPASLSYSYVLSLFEDRSGVLWIGTRGQGLNKYVPDQKQIKSLHRIPGETGGLPSDTIRSFAEDPSGNLWIGSEDQGLDYWNRKADTHTHVRFDPRNPAGLSSNSTYALLVDPSGFLWIGTVGGGLNRYDPKTGTFTHFRNNPADPGSLSHDSVRSLCRDQAGTLWVGTEGGGLNRYVPETNSFVHYRHDPARSGTLSHDIARILFVDRAGALWVGTFGGGLDKLDPETGTFACYRHGDAPDTLSNDFIMSLAEDARGNLLVGTQNGLNKFDPKTETFIRTTDLEGLPNNTIYGILIDEKENAWLSSNRGIARLNLDTGEIKTFNISSGLLSNEFNGGSYFKTRAGEMFFGGTAGVCYFFPGDIAANPYPPSVVLTDFQIFNESVRPGRKINGRIPISRAIWSDPDIELRYRDRMISFEFAPLHFAAPEKNTCAYMMEGLDKSWIYVRDRRFASYTNLPAGRYVFRVKAANADGLWNDQGVSVRLKVIPPFYKTWWFVTLAVLAAVSALGGAIGTRVGRARRRTALLESKVRERTAELQKQIAVREAAEKELEKRRQYLESIFTNAPNAIITVDTKSRVTEWNPGAERIFGWRRDEALGKDVDDLVIKKELKEEAVQLSEVANSGSSLPPREGVRHHKNGLPVPVIMGGSPIQVGDDIVGAMFVYTDITEIKKAERAAREANRVKSEFLANMSHEIRTPMNGIFGMTELALETDLTTEQREYMEAVQFSAVSLMSIINDILDFSKIEAKKIELETIPFRMRDTIHAMITGVALLAEKKGLELAYHIPSDVPDRVKGDPGRLRQILTNLLSNSIKFTQKGEVVVTVNLEEKHAEKVRLHIQVRDTGIGIPADKLKVIFAPFTQADTSATRIYGGTGLGLAITSQLVELMGGNIWVESELEKGSTFHFTVSLELQTTVEAPPVPARYEDLLNLPVLVVDDNATNRHILQDMLSQWGLRPTLAESAEKALELLQMSAAGDKKYRFIITDANMPLMDGFELAASIKKIPEFADIPIMMLSSAGLRGDSAHCRELGLAAYLTKPVKPALLLDAIMLALGTAPDKRAEAPLITRHSLSQVHTRYSILLAEDNIINQKLAVRILENRGHRVTLVGNGAEAVEALAKERFDVILMDVQMPVLDGLKATAEIRRRELATGTHVPIIAMTAHAMAGDREKCLQAGMDDYVTKPLKPIDLLKTMQHTVERIGKERRGVGREG